MKTFKPTWGNIPLIFVTYIFCLYTFVYIIFYSIWVTLIQCFKPKYRENSVSLIATYSILIGVLIYTFYYLPRKVILLVSWLYETGMSFYDVICYVLNHGQTYVEFATWATLLGLYNLLAENRKNLKQNR